MGNSLRLLVVPFALLIAATAFGLWAAARTTDHATAHRFELQESRMLVLPR
jgi:hypothetical protein